jgi:hypothetical protein
MTPGKLTLENEPLENLGVVYYMVQHQRYNIR